jgi:hypothetical protein
MTVIPIREDWPALPQQSHREWWQVIRVEDRVDADGKRTRHLPLIYETQDEADAWRVARAQASRTIVTRYGMARDVRDNGRPILVLTEPVPD